MIQNGGAVKTPVGVIQIAVFADGEIRAASQFDAIQTMRAMGAAQAQLAVVFQQKEMEKVRAATPAQAVKILQG